MQPLASGALFCCTACLTRTRRNSRLSRFCFPGFLRLCGLLRRQSSFFRSHSSLQSMPLPGQIVQESNPRFLHLSPTPSLARRYLQQIASAAAHAPKPTTSSLPSPLQPFCTAHSHLRAVCPAARIHHQTIIYCSQLAQNRILHFNTRPRHPPASPGYAEPPAAPCDGRPVHMFQLQPRRNHPSSLYALPPSTVIWSCRLVHSRQSQGLPAVPAQGISGCGKPSHEG